MEYQKIQYIGPKKVKEIKTLEDKTQVGSDIVEVTYIDDKKEVMPKMMYEEIISDKSCDSSELRDKRIRPVVASVLLTLREWGVKIGELPYFSALLSQSLEVNKDEALKELWRKWIPNIVTLDDVDTITIDRVLKTIKQDVVSPYNEPIK